MVKGKPILHESFIVTCNISFIHECLTFHWKIKGTDVEYTSSDNASKLKFTNLTTTDNSIKLECQVGMEKCVDENYAQHSCVSAESDTYMVLPYYGPYNVFFNLTENNIYLRENASFILNCYADCYPVCIFRWESYYMNVENEELVINKFESAMAGPYTCIARNRETNMTEKSRPVFLHHMKDFISVTTIHSYNSRGDTVTAIQSYTSRGDSGQREELYWIGPVFLIVVFVILVTLWRIRASRGINNRKKRHPRKEQPNSEVSLANAWMNSRALPCPPVQDVFTRRNITDYPKLQRHFRSLEKQDISVYNQIGESVSLQILSHSSDVLDRQISDDLSNLSVYDYSIDNIIEETSQETGRTERYYYESSSDTCHDETVDVHATDESYLHPISGLTYKLKTCQDDETDMNKTDQKYITIIDDFARPIEICQVEKTDVTETDPTYITPVT
ncbi:hypothetical protein CHS0354_001746 [Potamilus streckersoni]|uniref:Ig-like domain-containing protein n=1 Tax=Potamilus streckersoni TaxID=2493646 RepID=A0AAE0W6S4_9BIVA|nr:hypothetical protein CHS0354_001746 [Potamilus streckersoni]